MNKKILNIANMIGSAYFLTVFIIILLMPFDSCFVLKPLSLICTALIAFFYSKYAPKSNVSKGMTVRKLYVICALIILAADLAVAFLMRYQPVTDALYMDTICRNFVEGRDMYAGLDPGHEYYIDRYSNQWGMFLIQISVYKLVYIFFGRIPQLTGSIANILFFQLSYFFTYKLADKVFKRDLHKKICLLVMLFHPVLYSFSGIFYTDMMSMPFTTCALWLGISAQESKTSKKFLLYTCLTAVVIGMGYSVKGSIGIIAAAFIIYSFFTIGIKRFIVFASVIVVGFAGMKYTVTHTMYAVGAVTEESVEKHGFPMSHWIMMGLKGRGGYDDECFQLSFEQPDKDARHENSINTIKGMMKDYGISGFSEHLVSKLIYTWNNGTYQSIWQVKDCPDTFLKRIFISSPYRLFCLLIHYIIVLCMMASYLSSMIYRRTDKMFVLRLTILGLGSFLLIWETRCRYMLNMLPLFIMVAIDGLEQIPIMAGALVQRCKKHFRQ